MLVFTVDDITQWENTEIIITFFYLFIFFFLGGGGQEYTLAWQKSYNCERNHGKDFVKLD